MRTPINTHAFSHNGARWLAGNIIALAVGGTVIYHHTRPPQLSGAELKAAYLVQADLRNVNFEAAVLTDCDLARANLSGANLRGANLARANLAASRLQGADLREADLRGTNLESADLQSADLRAAIYDENTAWSAGVDPAQFGAMRVPLSRSQSAQGFLFSNLLARSNP